MKVIPSLTEEGWITDSKKMLDYILSYYILSDSMQSLAYQSNIINLPATYYKNINNPDGMMTDVRQDLEKLLTNYFVTIDVVVDIKELTLKSYAILIKVAVIDSDNNKVELSKITELNNSKSRKVISFSNYGSALDMLNAL